MRSDVSDARMVMDSPKRNLLEARSSREGDHSEVGVKDGKTSWQLFLRQNPLLTVFMFSKSIAIKTRTRDRQLSARSCQMKDETPDHIL